MKPKTTQKRATEVKIGKGAVIPTDKADLSAKIFVTSTIQKVTPHKVVNDLHVAAILSFKE